ncbi:MAG: DUF2971 domain-containing protein [Gammaproteobacteria bacterium]|nr:DUF2971 domain-containing protein [Gammaproteobacteria bacterium]
MTAPETLFKYMEFDVAVKVLASTQFRWSFPSNVNDKNDPYVDTPDKLDKGIGIFCVTKRFDNAKMWSKYGEDHKGIVIEIEVEKFIEFYSHGIKISQCEYTDEPQELKSSHFAELQARNIHYKKKSFNHEEEFRFVWPEVLRTSDIGCNSFKDGYCYEQFNPNCIKRIFIGSDVPADNINLLVAILNNLFHLYSEVSLVKLRSDMTLDAFWDVSSERKKFLGPTGWPKHIALNNRDKLDLLSLV